MSISFRSIGSFDWERRDALRNLVTSFVEILNGSPVYIGRLLAGTIYNYRSLADLQASVDALLSPAVLPLDQLECERLRDALLDGYRLDTEKFRSGVCEWLAHTRVKGERRARLFAGVSVIDTPEILEARARGENVGYHDMDVARQIGDKIVALECKVDAERAAPKPDGSTPKRERKLRYMSLVCTTIVQHGREPHVGVFAFIPSAHVYRDVIFQRLQMFGKVTLLDFDDLPAFAEQLGLA